MRRRVAIVIAAAAFVVAPGASASPQNVVGFGARSIALGGTGTASSEGADAVYANPSLLSSFRATELQLGFQGAAFSMRASVVGAAPLVAGARYRATTIGAVLPLPFGGLLKDRMALGLAFVTPTDVVVRARILYPERVQFPLADRTQSVAVQGGVGLSLGHGVRVGGGFAALAALRGSVLVQTDASGRVGTEVEDTLVASYAPSAGVSWESPGGRYRLGATFRGALVGRFNVVIRAENLGSLTIPPLNIAGVAQYDPWQLAFEAARTQGPWRLAVGATYAHWSAYPGPAEATVRCEDASVPRPDCGAPIPPAPGYRSVVTPRLGVERRLEFPERTRLSLRAGYAFEPSPVPEQTGSRNTFDGSRSVFSCGWGAQFERIPLGLDGFVQLHHVHEREHRKLVDEGAPSAGSVVTAGRAVAGGLAVTVRL